MPTGTVKLLFRSKGYGFIRPVAGGGDVFVHRSALEVAGCKWLRTGQKVGFDLAADQGRPVARNVYLLDGAGSLQSNLPLVDQKTADDPESVDANRDRNGRKPITRAALERSLTEMVRKIAPECEAFVGLILERINPETPNGANWIIRGVRFGKANRDKCAAALGVSLSEKQQEYTLVDDVGEASKQL